MASARTTLLLLLLLSACSRSQPATVTFIEDDYPRALAEAAHKKQPLFVDVWASWCHTCVSMKQYVLPDPALQPLAGSYVWLSIDSERRSNAQFLERFVSKSLPTLWVIDPENQLPVLKWIGAATAPELRGVLEDVLSERTAQPSAADPNAAEANAAWLRAQRASASGDAAQAIELYRRALAGAPSGWPRRPRALEALSMRLAETDHDAECVALAAQNAAGMPAGTARLNLVLNGIDAAQELPADAPERAALPELLRLGTRIAEEPGESVLLDDRSSLFLSLVAALEASPESARLAKVWSDQLDAAATRASTPAQRRVWDAHRVEAYLALGAPERAIPMLEQSERELPTDYNPPARLARVYLKLARLPEARAAIERALPRSEGPRKLRLYMLQADILLAAQDKPAARAALEAALDFARRSQLPAQYDKLQKTIERRVQDLS
ncbi:MAG TPA: thioredoxin family protein [Polyangiales bacterium]|nr:thioredoxin family protein [Polyangiales bacterium]